MKRSMRWVAEIAVACAGVRNRYPPRGFGTLASGAAVSNAKPSSPLGRIPKELLSFCGSARSLDT